jgi:hypothetical protein
MRSSTSSFERAVPGGTWSRAGAVALAVMLLVVGVWELKVRADGYSPCLNDSTDLWAKWRSVVGQEPDQTVVIGSSRILFDFDLDTYARYFNTSAPVQLAMPGSNPLAVLENVADDQKFRGTLILGVVPGLWFVPEGSPVERSRQAIGRFENWSPSQRFGLGVAKVLQKRLAFINSEDLTLPLLINRLNIADRPAAVPNLPRKTPPYFAYPDDRRQARMWARCDFGSPLALKIQAIWPPLFTPPPPPPMFTPEEFGKMMQASLEAHLGRIAAATEKLRARGVKVVFVRAPSTGPLRELENRFTPREAFWDRILVVSEFPGIHFEDYPDLARFECPEWSHLTAADAVAFSEALMPHIEEALK